MMILSEYLSASQLIIYFSFIKFVCSSTSSDGLEELVTTDIPWRDDSCLYRCVESYFPGRACYCNEACEQYENCCVDYLRLCRPDFVETVDWVKYEGHEYKYYSDLQMTSIEAQVSCQQDGAQLVSINEKIEYDFIVNSVIQKRVLSLFIGGFDNDGVWTWHDGSPMQIPSVSGQWHAWYNGQPQNIDDATACTIITNLRFWADPVDTLPEYFWRTNECTINANVIQGYICERTLLCDPNPCLNDGKCQYIGGDAEYECQCQQSYVGNRCQYKLNPNTVWTECGETNLVAGSDVRTLTSPLYPKEYPPNTQCEWSIFTEPGKTIKLDFEAMDIEPVRYCVFDSMSVYDGNSRNNETLLSGPMCGNVKDLTLTSYTSVTNQVLVVFNTDKEVQHTGFSLSYKKEVCGQGTGSSGCGSRGLFTAQCGSIDLDTGPQNPDSPCEVVIRVTQGHIVNLTFHQFNIFDSGKSCPESSLKVHDGSTATDENLSGTYCGFRFPWSLQSKENEIVIKLRGISWQTGYRIRMEYNSIDPKEWSQVTTQSSHVILLGPDATQILRTNNFDVNIRHNLREMQAFSIKCTPGHVIRLDTISEVQEPNDIIRIYDGADSNSRLLADLDQGGSNDVTLGQHLVSSSYKIFIMIDRAAGGQSELQVTLTTIDHSPELSGCYRPYYSDRADDSSTAMENHLVTSLKPVVVMLTDQSQMSANSGYRQGLYCKWTIRGEPGRALSLTFLEANIPPLSENCDHDGVVVHDGDQQYGPFCGSSAYDNITLSSNSAIIVFYSDSAYTNRRNGELRILVTNDDTCAVSQLESAKSLRLTSDCGTVLSPHFPGMVDPGLWSWAIESHATTQHYDIYVHYVKGPAVFQGDCTQSFKIIELPHDGNELKHTQATILKLCSDTDLFIPEQRLRLPPHQKIGIELDTASNSIPYQWQFKLSYKRESMVRPQDMDSEVYECADDYVYFRGSCYKYFPWVYRHYQEQFSFTDSWKHSQEHCEQVENATLVNIQDEEEAQFLKYILANDWFWDKSTTYQGNGRTIFIGLHNKYGRYEWSDGSQLSYADWHVPPPEWAQTTLEKTDLGLDSLDIEKPQPSSDVGSLCTAMFLTSPYSSLNWMKIPCDIVFYKSGMICEKTATARATQEPNSVKNPHQDFTARSVCPDGWFMIRGQCYQLLTNYESIRQTAAAVLWNYDHSATLCEDKGGRLASVNQNLLDKLHSYLDMWRHDTRTGHIWIQAQSSDHNMIKVYKTNPQHEELYFELSEFVAEYPRNVICQRDPALRLEECIERQEYQCGDLSCISVDSVCDGMIDCPGGHDELNCECSGDTFKCDNGMCISISLFCDFHEDCTDGSDERQCVLQSCSSEEFQCRSGQCISAHKLCDFRSDCRDGSDEDTKVCEGTCRGMQCYSGKCIPLSLKGDLISDCPGQLAEDEGQKEHSSLHAEFSSDILGDVNVTKHVGCDDETSVQCRQGEAVCYSRSRTCIYDTVSVDAGNSPDVQATCRDGAHLRQMCGGMECPAMFHCPGSYCLPHRKVCDGFRDCPDGTDELSCRNYSCPGMFRCKGESFCISHTEVCDGTVHCPRYRDDEKYCDSRPSREVVDVSDLCESGCNCTGHIIDCTGAQLIRPLVVNIKASTTKALLMSDNRFQLQLDSFILMKSLGRIVLSHNDLIELPIGLFVNLHNLFDLDLSHNLITDLVPDVFQGLVSLKRLNLHHNLLLGLQRETLLPLVQINQLIITDNQLSDVKRDVFDGIPTLRELNSSAYKFCCVAPQASVCTPEADEFSSCQDLMANSTLQIAIWVLGIIACVGNLFVVIWRMLEKKKLVSSFFIINLGISDFLMGVYLMIIASVDVYYRGEYILYADWWTSSRLCQFAGVLAMWSSEVSVFMLTAITADRVLRIVFPLKFASIRMGHARIIVLCGWVICLFLSIIPATSIQYFGGAFFGRTGVCLPFQVTNKKVAGWEYSLFIFLVLNLFSFVMIFIGYSGIFWKVKKSIKIMENKSTANSDEYKLAKKLMLSVATDFFCWVPIILIGFAALGGASISPQVSAWIAVFILPLNSAVNPLLYTIAAMDCKKDTKNRNLQPNVAAAAPKNKPTLSPVKPSDASDQPESSNSTEQTGDGSSNGNGTKM